MVGKFDLDSIKNLINDSESSEKGGGFSLDDIMSDFSSNSTESVKKPVIITDSKPEKNDLDAAPVNQITLDKSGVIMGDIEKPVGYSVTGAFEAIKKEKNTEKAFRENIIKDEPKPSEDLSQDARAGDKEIFTTIEHKRYFNTDMFNSIKNNKSTLTVKESIASFANGVEEEDDGEERFIQPTEPTEEIDDYNDKEDRDAIITELKKINASSSLRVLFTFILCAFSALFFAVSNSWISLPGIDLTTDFKLFTAISFGLAVLSTVINFNSVISGIKSIAKLRFTVESYIVVIFVLNTVLNVFYLSKPQNNAVVVSFDLIYSLFLLVNIYSKKLIAKTVYKNFIIASADGCKNVINMPNSEEAVNDIMLETGCQSDIVYASKTELVSDFIAKSFKDFESKNSRLETVLFFAAFLLSIVYFVLKNNIISSVVYFIGALCVVCPLLFSFCFAAPLFLNSKKTRRFGGVIVGSESANTLKDVQTLIVDDSDIFNVSLNGIRLYGASSIDDAIMYLNALYSKVGGPLTTLFSDMLSENIVSLPRIDDIYYHDTMGYSGLIHSKVFVAGNKKLMDHFGVDVDDSEYEIIYQQKSKHVLFVAYDGKLMGVFLLSYALSHGVKKAFNICEKNQISVCIAERDPNVNSRTLFDAYTPKEKILFNIISFRTARNCFDKFELRHKTPSLIISRTGIKGLAAALHCCKTMMFAFKTNKIIRILASVIGLPLITFLLFFSDASSVLSAQILFYQLLWALPILFVSLFSK